jgi:hypothetical protein
MQSLGAAEHNEGSLKQCRVKTTCREDLMQAATATLELPRHDAARNARSSAPSNCAYLTMIGAAALSAAALHMVRSTTAADLPDPLAQHLTRPTDLPHNAIDTSLKAIGL